MEPVTEGVRASDREAASERRASADAQEGGPAVPESVSVPVPAPVAAQALPRDEAAAMADAGLLATARREGAAPVSEQARVLVPAHTPPFGMAVHDPSAPYELSAGPSFAEASRAAVPVQSSEPLAATSSEAPRTSEPEGDAPVEQGDASQPAAASPTERPEVSQGAEPPAAPSPAAVTLRHEASEPQAVSPVSQPGPFLDSTELTAQTAVSAHGAHEAPPASLATESGAETPPEAIALPVPGEQATRAPELSPVQTETMATPSSEPAASTVGPESSAAPPGQPAAASPAGMEAPVPQPDEPTAASPAGAEPAPSGASLEAVATPSSEPTVDTSTLEETGGFAIKQSAPRAPIELDELPESSEEPMQLASTWEFVGWQGAEGNGTIGHSAETTWADRAVDLDGPAVPAAAPSGATAPEVPLASAWDFIQQPWQPPAEQAELVASLLAAASAPTETPAGGPRVTAEQVLDALGGVGSQGTLGKVLLAYCAGRFQRAYLLGESFGLVRVGHAWGPGSEDAGVSSLKVDLEAPSLLAAAMLRGAPCVFNVPSCPQDEAIFSALAGPSSHLLVAPIQSRGRPVAFIVADHGPQPVEPTAIEELSRIVSRAAETFDKIVPS